MKELTRNFAEEHFSLKRHVKELEQLYIELYNNSPIKYGST